MKKIKSYIILPILFTMLFIFPITNAKAATHLIYQNDLSSFTTASAGTYYMTPARNYKIEADKWYIHGINIDGQEYIAYCLQHGRNAVTNSSLPNHNGIINEGFDGLLNAGNAPIPPTQQELLKNILAAGFNSTGSEGYVNNLIQSADRSILQTIMATQILVWEVMDFARYGYGLTEIYSLDVTNNLGNGSLYSFVSQDPDLFNKYKTILEEAEKLADKSKPSTFGKDYVMHWKDNEGRYIYEDIDVGNYRYTSSSPQGIVTAEHSGSGKYTFSSTNVIKDPVQINFSITKGSTDSSATFKWFQFNSNPNTNQKIVVGYYNGTNTGSLNVVTEKGQFKITKRDKTTKEKIKGSKFEIYKCSSRIQCDTSKPVATINLKNNAESEYIDVYKKGEYLFRETEVPYGYEKIPDFYVTIDIKDDGKTTLSNASISGYVEIKNDTAELVIFNKARNFKINKIDGRTNNPINGATFKIKNSSGKYMKFVKEEEGYRYSSTEGTIEELYNSGLSTYTISLLPSGEYILEEVGIPYPYNLSSKQIERETKFKIDEDANLWQYNYSSNKYVRSVSATIIVKNFKTRVKIIKNGKSGSRLTGVVFELWNSNKTKQISVKTMANGEYEYNRDVSALPIQLVTNSNGEIIINYLPEGSYYLKEVLTVDGYVIDPSVEWTNFKVEINRDNASNITKTIFNQKGEFCFYKIDEDGNYLDDGKFKLQIYNEKISKFEDIPLIFDKTDNEYTIDSTYKSDLYIFSPVSNGQTCFKDVPAKTRYRVVEIEAPEGFVLPKISETQTELIINENGYAIGSPVIINKKIVVGEGAEAQAELIINIQTGQNRIHYLIVISILLLIITILFIIKKNIDKK